MAFAVSGFSAVSTLGSIQVSGITHPRVDSSKKTMSLNTIASRRRHALAITKLVPSSLLFPAPTSRPTMRKSRPIASAAVATPNPASELLELHSDDSQFQRFAAASEEGFNLVPVFRRIFCDHLTPVLAYQCLVGEDDPHAPSFLFESVENGEQGLHVGRFSMVAARPSIEVVAKADQITVLNHITGSSFQESSEDPMSEPAAIAAHWRPAPVDDIGLPKVFCGGWVGYFSYDTVRYTEKRKLPFAGAPRDDRELPDMHLSLYNEVVIIDHVAKMIYAVHWVHMEEFLTLERAYTSGQNHLSNLASRLQSTEGRSALRNPGALVDMSLSQYGKEALTSNFTPREYKDSVLKVKAQIAAGEIFQLVLSQRFERRTLAAPFEIYRALRMVNPSPYLMYMQARGCTLVTSSPEILTRTCTNDNKKVVVNRPLAGTRKRGRTLEEDAELEIELLGDSKENAEHVMLVDLSRNDVGKVAKPGTVKVERLMDVERYSHVMHISSTVTGELLPGLSCWDALRAALPVGTVSGAPKVRAMQIIDELEPTRRGPYSGGVGTVSFHGDLDVFLALRTMVIPTARNDTLYSYGSDGELRREHVVHLQAGAGIVADSDPASEHQECINKAAALARAIDLAEAAFT